MRFRCPAAKLVSGLAIALTTQAAWADCGVPTITFLDSVRIYDKSNGLKEPSGLSLSADGTHLWTVSDDTGAVIALGFDGKVLADQTQPLDVDDLEGIALDPANGRLLAVSEKSTEIVVIAPDQAGIRRVPLSTLEGIKAVEDRYQKFDPKDGLEGVAVHPTEDLVYVLKEKRPRLLLELSGDLSEVHRVVHLTPALGFVDDDASENRLDVSGVAVDGRNGCLWIVSDRGRRLFIVNPNGAVAHSFPLGWLDGGTSHTIHHAEGIAYDADAGRLFIVNDNGKHARLFTYEVGNGP